MNSDKLDGILPSVLFVVNASEKKAFTIGFDFRPACGAWGWGG
jgi:hypothetical protein